jgi:hypothetical protein
MSARGSGGGAGPGAVPRAVSAWRCPAAARRDHSLKTTNPAGGRDACGAFLPKLRERLEVPMQLHIHWLALILLAIPTVAHAELVRFHYAPMDACSSTMTQVPAGPDGALGELKRGFGALSLPYPYVVRPNQMVTFRHAYNGKLVTVPMRFPASLPRIEQRPDRIIYHFAEYDAEARFLPDGTVDVVYNSGFLSPLRFE